MGIIRKTMNGVWGGGLGVGTEQKGSKEDGTTINGRSSRHPRQDDTMLVGGGKMYSGDCTERGAVMDNNGSEERYAFAEICWKTRANER